ncbi:hypothetical protein [Hallella colorans]|nr:hypothetical protein [Hallella colorans]
MHETASADEMAEPKKHRKKFDGKSPLANCGANGGELGLAYRTKAF